MSDREFWQSFTGLLAALVVLTIVLFVLAQFAGGKAKTDSATETAKAKAIAERIKPVGEVEIGQALVSTANAAGAEKGKVAYDATCGTCHAAGIAGAPKTGDAGAWKDRLAKGKDALYNNAIKGFQGKSGFMPAKGGNASLADADVKAAVDFMVSKSK